MAYLRRPKDSTRRPEGRCRRHPKHQQPPGVCSVCLREKLAQLSSGGSSSSSSRSTAGRKAEDSSWSSTSSSLSPYEEDESESSASSLSVSPLRRFGSTHLKAGSNKDVLVKSRSIASFIPRRRVREDSGNSNKGERWFWSKLIPGRRRKKGSSVEGLKHSKTMRERVTN